MYFHFFIPIFFETYNFFNITKFIRNQFLFRKKKKELMLILTRDDFDRVDFELGGF